MSKAKCSGLVKHEGEIVVCLLKCERTYYKGDPDRQLWTEGQYNPKTNSCELQVKLK